MTPFRALTALAALAACTSAADAQVFAPYGSPYYSGGGLSYSRVRGRSALSVNFGFARGGYGYGGYGYGPGYGYGSSYLAPYGVSSTRVTVININPSPQIVYVPQPFFLPPDDELPPQRQRGPEQPEIIPVPPPEKEKLPPPPKKEEPKKEEPKKEEPKKEEPKGKGPRPDVELPRPPEVDPRDEYARLIHTGREMFGEQEYGRAAVRFRQAIRLEPDRPLAYFLLVQSLLERGEYHDAHDILIEGLKHDKKWPATKFRPQELYAANNLDEYTRMLEALERTHAKHLGDPVMLLLRGHALWFDGRKQQAAALFRKALAGPDRAEAERFLAELPDEGL